MFQEQEDNNEIISRTMIKVTVVWDPEYINYKNELNI